MASGCAVFPASLTFQPVPGVIINEAGVQFGKSIYETTKALYVNKKWDGGKTKYATMKTGDVAYTFTPSTQDGWTAKQADKLNSLCARHSLGKTRYLEMTPNPS